MLTYHQVVANFGDPEPYLFPDGRVSSSWAASILDRFTLPVPLRLSWGSPTRFASHVSCHKRILPLLEETFRVLRRDGLWNELHDYGGCFEFRSRRSNPRELSRHAWGIAVDLNVANNRPGTVPQMHAGVIERFAAHGFEWGGAWRRPDGMHFEFAALERIGAAVPAVARA